VAILTHMITPYRVPVYEHIAKHFEVSVFFSGHEKNRVEWRGIEGELRAAKVKRSWGLTIQYWKRVAGVPIGLGYFQLTPGFLLDLVRWKPDAIISTEMGFRTLVALFYGTLWRKPVWVWWGGTLRTEDSIGRLRVALRSLIARWAKRWISYGKTSTVYLWSLGIAEDRILEIQNCVDERIYRAPTEPAFTPPIRPVLLHVGQMIPRKGITQLLDVAKALQEEGNSFSLLLVGSGPERDALQQHVERLNLRDVHFIAGVPPSQMPSVYRSADLLVFPTLRDCWGLVANEAMWSGLPVLVSRYAGCAPELFPPECIFDPLDSTEFTGKLRAGLKGKLPPPDLSRLKTSAEVASMIVEDLRRSLSSPVAVSAEPTWEHQ
jgi:glycosyltransferase involved in cell wall biosynthesis